jgi:chemotaxis receptor (MCP) glutamine deamidase CheD/CheY-like chemotaxis protein
MTTDPIAPPNLERVFLMPGEYHVTKRPKFIATLLGSCVAVCLFNQRNGSAAMNHFIHKAPVEPNKSDIGRFGDLSTRYIIDSLLALDPVTGNYKAKIFGGGNVVGHLGAGVRIGEENIRMAKEILQEYRIPVVKSDTGGTRGRKIYFNTSDFSVVVRPTGEGRKDFTKKSIRVLVVDDSAIVRNILCRVIQSTEGMEVCGQAKDAFEARDMILSLDPDVISLDIIMPKLDGIKFLEKIMQHFPKPVVIVSTIAKDRSPVAQKAVKLGAVGVVDKDSLQIYKGLEIAKKDYIPMIRTASTRIVNKTIR